MPVASLPDVDLHYLQFDSPPAPNWPGEDILMVHGLASSLAFWYMRLAPAVASHYRVTLFDLRGHGRSGMPPSGYSPAQMAEDMLGLMDQTGIERVHLIAHSFGGLVCLHLARLYPERVRSLTLLDVRVPALQKRQSFQQRGYRYRVRQLLKHLDVELDEQQADFGYRLLEEMARFRVHAPSEAQSKLRDFSPFSGRSGHQAAKHWLRLLETTTARHDIGGHCSLTPANLEKIQVPTLAVYGDQSQALPSGQALKRIWPHTRFEVVPNAGHFFPVTRPEVMVHALKQFFIPHASD